MSPDALRLQALIGMLRSLCAAPPADTDDDRRAWLATLRTLVDGDTGLGLGAFDLLARVPALDLWEALKRSGMAERSCSRCARPFLCRDEDPLCPPCRGAA